MEFAQFLCGTKDFKNNFPELQFLNVALMKNVAIILAGGIGSRLNAGIPKQFLKVAGLTVIEHTISTFQHLSLIHISEPTRH